MLKKCLKLKEKAFYAAGETYLSEGMREPGWYKSVPRGLELKIGEKLTQLRAWDAEARKRGKKEP